MTKKTFIYSVFLFMLFSIVQIGIVYADCNADCGSNCRKSCYPVGPGEECDRGGVPADGKCWRCTPSCSDAGLRSSCPSGKVCREVGITCDACGNSDTCYEVTGDAPQPTSPPQQSHTICERINGRPNCTDVPGPGSRACRRDSDCGSSPSRTPTPTRGPSPTRAPTPTRTPTPTPPQCGNPGQPACPPCGNPGQPQCPPGPSCGGPSQPACPPCGNPGQPQCPPCGNPGQPQCPAQPTPTCTPGSNGCPNPTSTPRPTSTPVPTSTPRPTNTPTPTPQQRMRTVTPQPNTAIISSRASRPPASARTVCLSVNPCSRTECTTGAGKIADHRVSLTTQPGKEVLAGINTYVMECVKVPTNTATICTTGNSSLDNELFGTYTGNQSNFEYLHATYGYEFHAPMVTVNAYKRGEPLSNPFIAPTTNGSALGSMGIVEWQSHTRDELERTFYAMNYPDDLYSNGRRGTQQQGTWVPTVENTNCIMISWDPYGTVFDSQTLKPIKNAEVTLLAKRANGSFTKVEPKEVLGNFRNPYVTGVDGAYSFNVEAGEYRLDVKAEGYVFPHISSELNPDASKKYQNIYSGESIIQGKTSELRNIPLDKIKQTENIGEYLWQQFKGLLRLN